MTRVITDTRYFMVSEDVLSGIKELIATRLDKIEKLISGQVAITAPTYSDAEASKFLKISKKKLQQLRNSRKIGFVRENGGRRIVYKHGHLMEYISANELKKKK